MMTAFWLWKLKVPDPNNPDKSISLHDISTFLDQPTWCWQVEPIQKPGKILLVTTKTSLSMTAGHKWVDNNFKNKALFNAHFLSSPNPNIQQSNTALPQCVDCWLDPYICSKHNVLC